MQNAVSNSCISSGPRHLETLRVLVEVISQHEDVKLQCSSALIQAALDQNSDAFGLLVKLYLNDPSILALACLCGSIPIVCLLRAYGHELNAPNASGDLLLHVAASNSHELLVWFLLDAGADLNQLDGVGQNALMSTLRIVRLLLKKGAEVNPRDTIFGRPLDLAAHIGHLGVVSTLLDARASVNSRRKRFGSALFSALQGNNSTVLELLLQRGADPN
ncbi:ankyrin repeat-containing domain protein, partial [Ilyonectria destructans]